MNYQEALEYIHGLQQFGIKPGLARMEALLEHLGNPHLAYPCIHIAGTNGKGSVTAMVTSILRAAGIKTGRYTSPALQKFNERINFDGADIPDAALAALLTGVRPAVAAAAAIPGGEHPTEFEVVTAAAFEYFRAVEAEIAVLEAGLGGRLDSTNIIPTPLAAGITNVAFDHMNVLGDTIEAIAAEKAGIIKKRGMVVTGAEDPAALAVIRCVCREKEAGLWVVGEDIRAAAGPGGRLSLATPRRTHEDLTLSLAGAHQLRNAATAVGIIDALSRSGTDIDAEAVAKGLAAVTWPGRLEIVQHNPTVVLDGAHNPDGARALGRALRNAFRYERLILVLGILRDKAYPEMLAILAPLADTLILTKPDSPRAAEPEELQVIAARFQSDIRLQATVGQAVDAALRIARPTDLVCIAGSLYTVGASRDRWRKPL
ncbi:MAG: bifunctional folylpolyglutamate synthase/dihydrofolate synthase [bacterium]|jgi:dihydrofolate synthase/folylpolyglutamate synthase